ncbi:TerD family protein, partial [Streptomyces griseorubiginosus]|uniref:TerD family protein n=1 Tax=Streptomyces griseorubiginosus TaxID=67304 RepID=UPI001AD71E5C
PAPAPAGDPYRLIPFAAWKQAAPTTATAPPPPRYAPPVPPLPTPGPVALVAGQTLVLPEDAWQGLQITFRFAGADADLTLFLTADDGRVAGDDDFVFYNQPATADGAARLLGKQQEGPHTVERATLHLCALPERIQRVTIAINMDVETGLTCAALTYAALDLASPAGAAWTFTPPADPAIKAMVIAELYRHHQAGRPVWKLRALGQGWAEGLDALARAHGVDIT